MAITGKNVVLKDLNGEYIIPYNGCVKTINGNSPDENGNIVPNMTGCLPLNGGQMSGKIMFSYENVIGRNITDGRLFVFGGTGYDTGASLLLCGKDYANNTGGFAIYAFDGTNRSELVATPNGGLSWGGKEVERVNSSRTNYIRYDSGLQICWGSVSTDANGRAYATFPAAFVDTNYTVQTTALSSKANFDAGNLQITCGSYDERLSTGLAIYCMLKDGGKGGSVEVRYLAIGKWK